MMTFSCQLNLFFIAASIIVHHQACARNQTDNGTTASKLNSDTLALKDDEEDIGTTASQLNAVNVEQRSEQLGRSILTKMHLNLCQMVEDIKKLNVKNAREVVQGYQEFETKIENDVDRNCNALKSGQPLTIGADGITLSALEEYGAKLAQTLEQKENAAATVVMAPKKGTIGTLPSAKIQQKSGHKQSQQIVKLVNNLRKLVDELFNNLRKFLDSEISDKPGKEVIQKLVGKAQMPSSTGGQQVGELFNILRKFVDNKMSDGPDKVAIQKMLQTINGMVMMRPSQIVQFVMKLLQIIGQQNCGDQTDQAQIDHHHQHVIDVGKQRGGGRRKKRSTRYNNKQQQQFVIVMTGVMLYIALLYVNSKLQGICEGSSELIGDHLYLLTIFLTPVITLISWELWFRWY